MHGLSILKAAVFHNLIILSQRTSIKIVEFSTATTTNKNNNTRTTEEIILLFIILDHLISLAESFFF